jgi:hypothetical protein
MGVRPSLDGGLEPNTSDRQFSFRGWEVVIGLDELADPLMRNVEHGGNLPNAHQVNRHASQYKKSLASLQ